MKISEIDDIEYFVRKISTSIDNNQLNVARVNIKKILNMLDEARDKENNSPSDK